MLRILTDSGNVLTVQRGLSGRSNWPVYLIRQNCMTACTPVSLKDVTQPGNHNAGASVTQ